MPASGVRVVLFDLDGTLTDSQSGIIASYRHALERYGLDAPARAIRPWIGPPLVNGLAALGVPPGELDAAVATFRDYFSTRGIFDNHLYPGVAEMLAGVAGSGAQMGLVTSKLTEYAARILGHFEIADYFSVVAGSTRDGSRLHKDEVLDHALEELGRPEPCAVVMVGDREQDIHAAIKHGVRPVGVTWGYGTSAELEGAGAEELVGEPGDLIALLLGGGG